MKPIFLLTLLISSLQTWSQPPHYQVYALKFASAGHPFPISDWVDNGPKNDSVNIDFMVWLIKGDNGKNILVDAGFQRDMMYIEDAKEFAIKNYTRPDSVLPKLGLKAGDITDIILSHPHWDHIDGISLFPNAKIWIQKEDYNYYVGAAWQKDGSSGGFEKRDVHMLQHLQPASQGGTFDPTAYVNSMRRMKTLVTDPKYIIPGHDSKIFGIFPNVAAGIAKIE